MPEFGRLGTSVAPHAGAWNETEDAGEFEVQTGTCRPHAGAWIETLSSSARWRGIKVATRGRGLKTQVERGMCAGRGRPPRGGVD